MRTCSLVTPGGGVVAGQNDRLASMEGPPRMDRIAPHPLGTTKSFKLRYNSVLISEINSRHNLLLYYKCTTKENVPVGVVHEHQVAISEVE